MTPYLALMLVRQGVGVIAPVSVAERPVTPAVLDALELGAARLAHERLLPVLVVA